MKSEMGLGKREEDGDQLIEQLLSSSRVNALRKYEENAYHALREVRGGEKEGEREG